MRLLPALLLVTVACAAHGAGGPRSSAAAARPPARPAPGPSAPAPRERAEASDPAGGSVPRAWRFTRAGTAGAEVLVRLEQDLDGDGAVDTWWRFEPDGAVAELAWDADFDGRPDGTIAFAGGAPARKVEALGTRGRVETAYERGAPAAKAIDLDGDGRADVVEAWSEGRVIRLGDGAEPGGPPPQK
jgi:hypothetical protein